MRYFIIAFALMTQSLLAQTISDFTPEGSIITIPGGNDLSGAAYITRTNGENGPAYVDNKTGLATLPFTTCWSGGDLESIAQKNNDYIYTLNEAKNGIRVINIDTCNIAYSILLNMPTGGNGGDGLEGVAVYNNEVYVIDEVSGTIYKFTDDGTTSHTPTLVFDTDCINAGDLTFSPWGTIIVVCEPPSPMSMEYDFSGNHISSLSHTAINNAEGNYFDPEGNYHVVGEPDVGQKYTADTVTPRPTFLCDWSGQVELYEDTGEIVDVQALLDDIEAFCNG